MQKPAWHRRFVARAVLVLLVVPVAALRSGAATGDTGETARAIGALQLATGWTATITTSPRTGRVVFVSGGPDGVDLPDGVDASPEARARAFADIHGIAFGLRGSADTKVLSSRRDELGMDHVRLQQMHRDVPVTAGGIVVHLRGERVMAANGEILADAASVATEPRLTAAEAVRFATELAPKVPGLAEATFSEPRLEILNRSLLKGGAHPTRLAWFIEATGPALRQLIWVDARRGGVILHFNQLPTARNRQIHTAQYGPTLPGLLVRVEGGAPTTDIDADLAYDYSGHTYDYFFSQHGRDSYDGAGAPLVSTVQYCPGACPWANAGWNGQQMVYGQGFSRADDVVAHELTHAVIDREASLFYYMQSGALNESFSDVFGETIDLTNGAGNDAPASRWLLGEDLPGAGAVRHMMAPTTYGQPGKVSDAQYYCGEDDGGGVHVNSGVPNHAYALMADGGFYNGQNVAGIGLVKAGKVQYRALTSYLLSGSDFLDASLALRQSCADLVGSAGITAADCTEVGKALDAVQMNSPAICGQAPVPELCPAGQVAATVRYDTLEDISSTDWVKQTIVPLPTSGGLNHWDGGWGSPNDIYWPYYATSGVFHFWGWGAPGRGDSTLAMSSPVNVPSGGLRVQFNHSFDFENNGATAFDGGVVEKSADGVGWADASFDYAAGAWYNANLPAGFGNPIGGRLVFAGSSFGYTATQLRFISPGPLRLRFRIGTDPNVGDDPGWFIDDIRFYTCGVPTLSIDDLAFPEGGGIAQVTVRLSAPVAAPVSFNFATANGTATAGQDYVATSGTITIPAGAATATVPVTVISDGVSEPNEELFVNLGGASGATIADSQAMVTILDDESTRFYTLAPCRLADTRDPPGGSGGPALVGGSSRVFPVGGRCGVPITAKAVAVNVTIVNPNSLGNLRLYPAHAQLPAASTINFLPGWVRANNAITPLGSSGFLAVACDMTAGSGGNVHFLLDVSGYFE